MIIPVNKQMTNSYLPIVINISLVSGFLVLCTIMSGVALPYVAYPIIPIVKYIIRGKIELLPTTFEILLFVGFFNSDMMLMIENWFTTLNNDKQ